MFSNLDKEQKTRAKNDNKKRLEATNKDLGIVVNSEFRKNLKLQNDFGK